MEPIIIAIVSFFLGFFSNIYFYELKIKKQYLQEIENYVSEALSISWMTIDNDWMNSTVTPKLLEKATNAIALAAKATSYADEINNPDLKNSMIIFGELLIRFSRVLGTYNAKTSQNDLIKLRGEISQAAKDVYAEVNRNRKIYIK